MMKKTYLLYLILAAGLWSISLPVAAQQTETTVHDITLSHNDGFLLIDMDLDLTHTEVGSNRALLIIPRLANGDRRRELPSVGIYGRKQYIQYLRGNGNGDIVLRDRDKPARQHYQAVVDYESWMDGARLELQELLYGCCQEVEEERMSGGLGVYSEPKEFVFTPQFVYISPEAEVVKSRSLSGSAYISFPVGKTEINDSYGDNRAELARIRATIDSVRNDSDIRITALSICGYASPEGRYAANDKLAGNRTAALKDYVSRLYDFPESFITTSHVAEDWAGLRAFVGKSDLKNKDAILELIDSSRDADNKEWKIKSSYPEDYRYLLEKCYPALRHSDYRVEYVIRSYSDPEEIMAVMRTQPGKLSLQEFYLATRDMEPGSDSFNEVFETAVRMYPDDATANLNAANTALSRGDTNTAARYLEKAGTSPQATYARGILAVLQKNKLEATRLFKQAYEAGVSEAGEALKDIEQMKDK